MGHDRIVFFGGIGASNAFGGELTKNKEIISRLRDLGYKVTTIDSFRARSKKLKLIKIMLKFFICIFRHPKATFIFSTSFGNVYPLFKILYYTPLRLHIVFWVIGGILTELISEGAYQPKYLKLVQLFVMEGVKMKKWMLDLGFNNVWYEPNFKTIGELPQIRKADDGRIHFLFISRIMPDKGCRYIMQCISTLNKHGFSDRFVVDFYGCVDDVYRNEFDENISKYKNVNYCGHLQLLEASNYQVLARYHYMLFPTYWFGEGFPGVVIDAYKAGIPIIGSDWNINSEFIKDSVTGIIIPTHSVDKLYEAMENAIMGFYDNETLSKNCQQEVQLYDTKRIINEHLLNIIIKCNKCKEYSQLDET